MEHHPDTKNKNSYSLRIKWLITSRRAAGDDAYNKHNGQIKQGNKKKKKRAIKAFRTFV